MKNKNNLITALIIVFGGCLLLAAFGLHRQAQTILTTPHRILVQLSDKQVKGFYGTLHNEKDAVKIETPRYKTTITDSSGNVRPVWHEASTILIYKANINLLTWEEKQ